MSFFDISAPDPEPEEPEPAAPVWAGPSERVLPAISTQRAILARTDEVLLSVDRFLVYPTGIAFTLMLLRRSDHVCHDNVPWEMFGRPVGDELPDDFMRFGLLFADGTTWTNVGDRFPRPDGEVTGPVVIGQGGGGGGRSWRMRYWTWPLPAPGDLTFVVSWPAEGIDEQRAKVDGREFHQLLGQTEQIWPED